MNNDSDIDAGAFQVMLTTTDSAASADELARGLVCQRLAASVQVAQVDGVQRRDGEVETSPEWQLWIKTTDDREDDIHEWLGANHPHDRPEIASFPITDINPFYLETILGKMRG